MGGSDPPKQRDPAVDYGSGIKVYLDYLDRLLGAEQGARGKYDPERLQQQLDYTDKYGPQFDAEAKERLAAIDPQNQAVRSELGRHVLEDVSAANRPGTELPKLPTDLRTEIESGVRGSQTARGNILGKGAGQAEALFKGQNALDLYKFKLGLQDRDRAYYNQILGQAGTYLSTPTELQQINQLQPVTPDRQAAYTVGGFNAGPQGVAFGQQAYQNALAANAQQSNPWATALGGAASGAAVGTQISPGWGTAIGAVAGGAYGYFASDVRLKENIDDTGERHRGVRLVDFNFKGRTERIRGVIADEVERVMPWLVHVIDGIKCVNYAGLGLQMRRVE